MFTIYQSISYFANKNSFLNSKTLAFARTILLTIFILLAISFQANLFAQNQQKVDSLLKTIVIGNDTVRVNNLAQLCWEYHNTDLKLSIKYGEEALALARKKGINKPMPQILNYVGVVYRNLGVFSLALNNFYDALKKAEENNDTLQIGYSYNNIADIRIRQNNVFAADSNLKNALSHFQKLENQRGIAYCYNQLALLYEKRSLYDQALLYNFKALEIREKQNDVSGKATTTFNIGNIYLKQKKYEQALNYIQQSMALYQKINHLYGVSESLVNISEYLFGKNDMDKSLSFLQKALEIARQINSAETQNKIAGKLFLIYQNKKDFEMALKYHIIFKQTADSLAVRENELSATRRDIEYEFEKKQVIHSREIRQIKMIRNTIVLCFLISLLFLGLVWRSRVQIRHQNQLLEVQKRDIVEKSEEISSQRDELKALNVTKDKFFNLIAHDLRSPFCSLISLTESLISNYDEISEEQKLELFKIVNKSAVDMHALLENLLEWARSQTSSISVSMESFNIGSVIESNIELSKLSAEKKQITLFCKQKITTFVKADINMINSVLRNLIGNAIKFTKIKGTIEISVEETDHFVEVSVADNGVGIMIDDIAKLFRLDIYITHRGTSNEKGTGLGLLICKEFVERNGGSISVASIVGEGTTFRFTVPKA